MIEVKDLTKKFRDKERGEVVAVDHISFEVKKGEIFGLLGPNGAGKTTTLRMLASVLVPSDGSARVAGFDVRQDSLKVRQNLGFLSGDMGLYHRLTPRETIRFFGRLHGMGGESLEKRTSELIERFDMLDFADSKVDSLSTGMKQKTALARTLVPNPPVLILDEPTSGLDVPTARTVEDFILEAKGEGKCIIFSSHVMEEVEYLCDRLAVINKGRIQAVGTMEALKEKTGKQRLREVFIGLLNWEEKEGKAS